jgi:hypothetical protein
VAAKLRDHALLLAGDTGVVRGGRRGKGYVQEMPLFC